MSIPGSGSKLAYSLAARTMLIVLVSISLFSCQKTMDVPNDHALTAIGGVQPLSLQLSVSRLVLLQGNEDKTAFTMSWTGGTGRPGEQGSYIVEAAVRGTGFAEPVVVGSSVTSSINFNVRDFNRDMRRILEQDKASMIDLRVKAISPAPVKTTVYSDVIALEVTPYHEHISYEPMQVIRIPGNYQSWVIPCAPKVISPARNGEYEGYIDFNHPYAQFLMVKGAIDWDPKVTYNYIGNNKFGFGGSVFSIFGGAGVYQFKVNTNTNTWSYTKINKWEIKGTALGSQTTALEMKRDEEGITYRVTTDLQKGSFRINANGADAIGFGHNATDPVGVPSYNGETINISSAGNYTISLSLTEAGNYSYTVQRNG
jgi:hypothetical protein